MNTKFSQYKKYLILITFAIVLYLGLSNINSILSGIGYFFGVISPILIGCVIAFLLNLVVNLYEKRVFRKIWIKVPKLARFKRLICVILTVLSILIFLTLLILFIVPQVSSSFQTLVQSLPSRVEAVTAWVNSIIVRYHLSVDLWGNIMENWREIFNSVSNVVTAALPRIFDVTIGVTNSLYNIFFGFIIAFYLLFAKEKLSRIIRKLLYAFLRKDHCEKTLDFFSFVNRVFCRFVGGQFTEALILGSLCAIGLAIIQVPYPLLIGVIVGITSLVPIIGAYVGVIFSALILLMVDPIKALWFLIYILILQQIEGNVIYPRVVGSAVGISGLWILSAIVVGGSLFGVAGMLIAVPLCSIVYTVLSTIVNRRLKEKNIVIDDPDGPPSPSTPKRESFVSKIQKKFRTKKPEPKK